MVDTNTISGFLEQEQIDASILSEVSTVGKLSQEMKTRLLDLIETQRVESETIMSSLQMYFISQSNILLGELVENERHISSLQYDEIMMLGFAYYKGGKQSEIDMILEKSEYSQELKNFLTESVMNVSQEQVQAFLEQKYQELLM